MATTRLLHKIYAEELRAMRSYFTTLKRYHISNVAKIKKPCKLTRFIFCSRDTSIIYVIDFEDSTQEILNITNRRY
jgi:hypothetical protein